jgi:hypothetical protein
VRNARGWKRIQKEKPMAPRQSGSMPSSGSKGEGFPVNRMMMRLTGKSEPRHVCLFTVRHFILGFASMAVTKP